MSNPVRIFLFLSMFFTSECHRSSGGVDDDTDSAGQSGTSDTDATTTDMEQTATDVEQATILDTEDTNQVEGQEYDQGVYHCCAKGQGTSCCDGYEQGMCFEYGGVYGGCIRPGEEYEAKVICAHCCEGLERADEMVITDEDWTEQGYPEGCGPSEAPPSMGICVNCTDGICGSGENICICPEDCS